MLIIFLSFVPLATVSQRIKERRKSKHVSNTIVARPFFQPGETTPLNLKEDRDEKDELTGILQVML